MSNARTPRVSTGQNGRGTRASQISSTRNSDPSTDQRVSGPERSDLGTQRRSNPPTVDGPGNRLTIDEVAAALGATQVTRAWPQPEVSPSGLLQLASHLQDRLKSTGGRPSDPTWTLSRRVPFTPQTWKSLQTLAEQLGKQGRSIAPAQLAATLVEERVAELDAAIRTQAHGQGLVPASPN